METLDNTTLVTATGGHRPHVGAPPFVPEAYLRRPGTFSDDVDVVVDVDVDPRR